MSEKIKSQHLARKAMLYVRQSSMQQVGRNEESRRLQYGMEHRLRQLGWREIELVDEDLGRSAAGTTQRSGFERMVAEVCLGKVGAVGAREVSRFARNSREWQQLVEVCRIVDTLLVDHETVYDSRRGNDRLLLGLKGSLNEYELDLLRLRSVEARREKARRGELIITPPVGYVKTEDDRLVKEADRRVQEALLLVFKKFLELGTARQAMMWFIEQGIELPVRRYGPAGWETVWTRPRYRTLLAILRNPIYAGAYTYGKTEITVEFQEGRSRKKLKRKPMENWLALIYDHHESYIEREKFERIQEMISRNAQLWYGSQPGAPKRGPALLAGVLRCRRCGRKLMVRYTGQLHDAIRYICGRGELDNADPRCISFGGRPVDEALSRQILEVVEPGAIDAAIQAGKDASFRQDDVLKALSLDLEAARYGADRAWKQYDAADPENRLVVDELERRWNVALERTRELEERIQHEEARLKAVRPPTQEIFEELSQDLEKVWNDPQGDMRLKKRILRTLIQEIIADVDSEAGEVVLVIHWQGGVHSELRVRRRRRGQNSAQAPTEVVEAIRTLTLICPDTTIAGFLNRNGLRTGRGNRWTRERVASVRSKRKIACHSRQRQEEEGWMNLTQAAACTGLHAKTLRQAAERSEVQAMHPLPDGPWVFKRADLDQPSVRRLIERVGRRRGDPAGQAPGQLTLF